MVYDHGHDTPYYAVQYTCSKIPIHVPAEL